MEANPRSYYDAMLHAQISIWLTCKSHTSKSRQPDFHFPCISSGFSHLNKNLGFSLYGLLQYLGNTQLKGESAWDPRGFSKSGMC